MAINGEISIPILNEERRFLMGDNIGSVAFIQQSDILILSIIIKPR